MWSNLDEIIIFFFIETLFGKKKSELQHELTAYNNYHINTLLDHSIT